MLDLDAWTAWVILGIAAAIVEVLLPHFGIVFVGLAALGGALVAYLGYSVMVQIMGFLLVLGLSLVLLRPWFLARLGTAPGIPGRTEALVGKPGVVTEAIDTTIGTGRVNVGGEDWAARGPSPIPLGAKVRVIGADGIVLKVTPS